MKKIFISGAGTGIGQATALRFAKDDAQFWIVGRRADKLENTKQLILKNNPRCNVVCVSLDVSDDKAVVKFFESAPVFDICVNNAAVEGARGEVQDLSVDDFDEVFDINVRALFQFCSLQIKAMRSAKNPGAIINIASVAGIVGIPTSSLYCATKAAVIGFTKTIALEQAPHGIRINTICPAGVETDMLGRIVNNDFKSMAERYPVGRIGRVEEIAEAVAYLTHENSKFIIGHSLILDGGVTIG
jgi:NAD(P)-dependent dehydrogenase (short-subunit alcohol dehydrogenase family)